MTALSVHSPARPPGAQLFELDVPAAIEIDRLEGRADLLRGEAGAQQVEQLSQLAVHDAPVPVAIDALEAVTKWIATHGSTIRRFVAVTNCALALGACRGTPQSETLARASASSSAAEVTRGASESPHAASASSEATAPPNLSPLEGPWLQRLGDDHVTAFVAPPLGATAARPLVVAVHGAGDRPEWSCGGWRLATQSSALVLCPQGRKMSAETFAWGSAQMLTHRVEAAVELARARFAPYVDDSYMIFAGFSQGATLAQPLLMAQAARFPIAILAEGGYRTAESAAFARAYRAGGGRRVVLACGTPTCFQSSIRAKKVLEAAGVEAPVVGDPAAGHNLNERMQRALQAAWPQISSPPWPAGGDH